MKQLPLLLTIFYITQITQQACNTGCLACTTKNDCILCDANSNFVLDKSTKGCKKMQAENCEHQNKLGVCYVCAKTFYPHSSTKKCTKVTEKKLTDNPDCEQWSSSQNCLRCLTAQFVSGSKCVAVETEVDNCQYHTSKTACGHCKPGFQLTADNLTCEVLPDIANCAGYSNTKCTACQGSKFFNYNQFLSSLKDVKSSSVQDQIVYTMLAESMGSYYYETSTCQPTTVSNCANPESATKCGSCQAGYYMGATGKCAINPIEMIANCSQYVSSTKCVKCEQGFRIDGSKCTAVTPINNCSKYSQLSTTSTCNECQSQYFLATSKTCTTRTKTQIGNCSTYHLSKDSCGICASTYVGKGTTTSGYTECVKEVSNCLTHTITNSVAKCTGCKAGYVIEQNGLACVSGNVSECAVYQQANNNKTCTRCKNKFYKDTTCKAHDNIEKCSVYHSTNKNKCLVCDKGNFGIELLEVCNTTFNVIANCKTYDSTVTAPASKCTQCEDLFYLGTSGATCEAIGIAYCKTVATADKDVCEKCDQSNGAKGLWRVLDANAYTCNYPLSSVTTNCQIADDNYKWDIANNQLCKSCQSGTYPYDLTNQAVCVKIDRMDSLNEGMTYNTTNTANAKCAVFGTDNTCLQCEPKWYLNATNQCIESCTQTTVAYTRVSGKKYLRSNSCDVTSGLLEVRVIAPDVTDSAVGNIHIQCATDSVTVVDLAIGSAYMKYSNVNPDSTLKSDWVENPLFVTNQVSCKARASSTDTFNGGTAGGAIPVNCLYFKETSGTTAYSCIRCKSKKTGKGSDLGHLDCSMVVDGCASSDQVFNIHPHWTKVSSCNSCQSTTKVPILLLEGADINTPGQGSFVEKNLKHADWAKDTTNASNNYYAQTCITATQTAMKLFMGFDETGNSYIAGKEPVMVDNCGFYTLNTKATQVIFNNSQATSSTADATLRHLSCGYCKPGFKATVLAVTNMDFIVTNCAAIDNCSSTKGNFVNACSQCASNYVWDYSSNKINYDVCVAYSLDANCIAAADVASARVCKFCKKSYSLNHDNKCEQLTAPNCSTANWFTQSDDLFDKALRQYLYQQKGYPGCRTCISGHKSMVLSGLNASHATIFCVTNPFVSDKSKFLAENSSYVADCANYNGSTVSSSGVAKCAKCIEGYFLNNEKTKCISLTVLADCVEGNTAGDSCLECSTTHAIVLVSSKQTCQSNSITNCKTTVNKGTATAKQQCSVCEEGYYYDTTNNICSKGWVPNCDVYDDNVSKQCNTCMDGFAKINDTDMSQSQFTGDNNEGRDYCMMIPSDSECSVGSFGVSSGILQFTCATCKEKHKFPKTPLATALSNKCYPYNTIDKCKEYGVGTTMDSTNFSCKECESGLLRTQLGYMCEARVNKPSACATYHPTNDVCQSCKPGNFLSTNQKECISYPTGNIGCSQWETVENRRVCKKCIEATYYMSEGKCIRVDDSKKDSNCSKVEADNRCTTCKKGYFLVDEAKEGTDLENYCIDTQISDCLTLSDKDNCEVCDIGFKNEANSEGKNRCVDLNNSDCLKWNGDVCVSCSTGKYADSSDPNGKCTGVETSVIDCISYSDATTCVQCGSGKTLTNEGLKCETGFYVDSSCSNMQSNGSYQCSACKGGYRFNALGECEDAGGKSGHSSGCWNFDPEVPTLCRSCRTGYHMTMEQVCESDATVAVGPAPEQESTSIYANYLIVMVLLMMFK